MTGNSRIRIALINLTSGGLSGGYHTYLKRMLPLLAADERVGEVMTVFPVAGGGFRTGEAGGPTIANMAMLKREIARFAPHVAFIPSARWTDLSVPTVIMVRNMEPMVPPTDGTPPLEVLRNFARRAVARYSCRRADRVIAVSQYVRGFLVDRFSLPDRKVGLVYHGVSTGPEGPAPQQPATAIGFELGRFIFTAGSIRPARGLEDLISALAKLTPIDPSVRLAIAGSPDRRTPRYRADMDRLATRLGVSERVAWLGHISAAEMAWCFSSCGAFAMTSRVEACPNIALEAMSNGAPVVSCDNPPMPEFFGESASYYRSGDPGTLADALRTVLEGGPAIGKRVASGKKRAEEFRWTDTARLTVDELVLAIKGV